MSGKTGIIVIVVVLIALGGIVVWQVMSSGGRKEPVRQPKAYFMNLANGQLESVPARSIPPIQSPGGAGELVAAKVMSCGACSADEWYIGYLEKFTGQTKIDLERAAGAGPGRGPESYEQMLFSGGFSPEEHLVADPEDSSTWYTYESSEGRELVASANEGCGRDEPVECAP